MNGAPPWRQPRGYKMVSCVNSHSNATSRRWYLWEIGLLSLGCLQGGIPPLEDLFRNHGASVDNLKSMQI